MFCAFLSPGTDATNCGRPCDHHDVKLRDRVGALHPLKADVGCRNTLYNAVPQTTAEYLPRLIKQGACLFRIELLDDEPAGRRADHHAVPGCHRRPARRQVALARAEGDESVWGDTRGAGGALREPDASARPPSLWWLRFS